MAEEDKEQEDAEEEPEKRRIHQYDENSVELAGRLYADPVRGKRDCQTVATMRVITENRWKSEIHDVVAYDDLAEVALATFKQGGDIAILGFIHWKWESDLVANAEVVAERIRDLGSLEEE